MIMFMIITIIYTLYHSITISIIAAAAAVVESYYYY